MAIPASKREPSSGDKRFENLFVELRRHRTRYLVVLLALIAVTELVAEVAIVGAAFVTGREYEMVARQLFLASEALRPFLPRLPAESVPGVRYVGDLTDYSVSSRLWFPADGLLGHRLGASLAITDPHQWRLTNDQGFASSGDLTYHYEKQKRLGTFRIIILGGSTVEGEGAESPFANLPSQLERALGGEARQRQFGQPYDRFEVINAGVSGYRSGQEYLYLLVDLLGYQPDLVIFYDGWNDFAYLQDLRYTTNTFRDPTHALNAARVNESFTISGSTSHLVGAIIQAAAAEVRSTAIGFAMWQVLKHAAPPPRKPEIAEAVFREAAAGYRKNIERSILVAAQENVSVAFFLQPILGVDDKKYGPDESRIRAGCEHRDPARFSRAEAFYRFARENFGKLRNEYAQDRKVCVADISRTALRDVHEDVYVDDGHLRGAGNEAVARSILAELDACNVLPWLHSRPEAAVANP